MDKLKSFNRMNDFSVMTYGVYYYYYLEFRA